MFRIANGVQGNHRKTVLVVDDEAPILGLVRTMLERAGYLVLEASTGSEALQIAAHHPNAIDLLLTDILMPEMDGFQLAQQLQAQRPGVRVLYMSGYLDVISRGAGGLGAAPCIRKPFKQHALTEEIARVLEASAGIQQS